MRAILLTCLTLLTAGAATAAKPSGAPAFGLVNLSAANFRSAPAQSAELATQASFGTPVKVVKEKGEWLLVDMPDGYRAWIDRPSVTLMNQEMMERWRNAPRLIVTSMTEIHAVADTVAGLVPDNIVSDLVLGSILEGEAPEPGAGYVGISFPDGRSGYVAS